MLGPKMRLATRESMLKMGIHTPSMQNGAKQRQPQILSIAKDGTLRCLWTERLPLASFGTLTITRASSIEFDHAAQSWQVIIGGSVHYSHRSRDACLEWEHEHFNRQLAETCPPNI